MLSACFLLMKRHAACQFHNPSTSMFLAIYSHLTDLEVLAGLELITREGKNCCSMIGRRGGFMPPCGEANSPLRFQAAPTNAKGESIQTKRNLAREGMASGCTVGSLPLFPGVARLEQRSDRLLSTLRKAVKTMD